MFAGLKAVYSFFQSSLKRTLRHAARRLLTFHCGGAVFVLEIYLDEEKADRDQSKVLTAAEAFYLAVALSLDSLLSGMALGLDITQPLMIVAADFAAALFSIFAGSRARRPRIWFPAVRHGDDQWIFVCFAGSFPLFLIWPFCGKKVYK